MIRITINTAVPTGVRCRQEGGSLCYWRYKTHPGAPDRCRLYDADLEDAEKCFDCLKACIVALEGEKQVGEAVQEAQHE